MNRASFLAAAFLVLLPGVAPAAEETVGPWKDTNENGKNDYREIHRGKTLVRVELDRNEDGKPDKFIKLKKGVNHTAEADTNHDGTIDTWIVYNSLGAMALRAQDRDKDGKPEYFNKMLKGSKLILREWDSNKDGRIDKRTIVEWGEKRYAPGMPKVPGYFPIMREADTDFDGKVDIFYKKGDRESRLRVGQPIDPKPDLVPHEEPKPASGAGGGDSGSGGAADPSGNKVQLLVDRMNERFGYDTDEELEKKMKAKKVIEV